MSTGEIGTRLKSTLLSPGKLPTQLSNLCDTMLQYDWREEVSVDSDGLAPKLHYSTRDVGLMMKFHLKWSIDPLGRVKFFVQDILSELKQLRYHEPCDTYPTISIGTYSLSIGIIYFFQQVLFI